LSYHEMWRDEVGLWLHLRHAESLSVLLNNLDYGGHPLLWPLLVLPLARLSSDPFLMQCLHLALATASALLVFRYAPFTFAEKILLVFGYYLSFEYAVITRHYALSVLLLLGHLSLRSVPRTSAIPPAIYLALLAETNVFGTILAAALLAGWLLEGPAAHRGDGFDAGNRPGWLAVGIVLTGIVIAIIDMLPPADYVFARVWYFGLDSGRLWQTLERLWRALFPIPAFRAQFWNSNVLGGYPRVAAVAGVVLLALCLWLWRRQRAAVVTLAVGAAGLLAFFYTKHMGAQRHHGFLFLAMLAAYWLYRRDSLEASPGNRVFRAAVWIPLLFVHVFVALFASYMDYRLPFSGSCAAADYLRTHNLQDRPIAVYPLEWVKPVAVLLDRHLYHLGSGKVEKYAVFNRRSYRELPKEVIANRARDWIAAMGEHAIVVLSDGFTLPVDEFDLLAQIPQTAIVGDERYAIYAAKKNTPGMTPRRSR